MNDTSLPSTTTEATNLPDLAGHSGAMSPAHAIWFDDRLFERAKMIATYLSKAKGFVPPHLIGAPESCFAVVERSLTWKLSPYAVAQSTYQTPGGRVGYEGKLCQAVLENSGKLEGPVRYEHYGDWSKVQGKFTIAKSAKGNDYAKATWTREDAIGLGVTVSAKVRGEAEPRKWSFDLIQAFPLNSTLWATDPKTQICYTAVRRFASVAAPGLFMGVPFDREDESYVDLAERARDINPRPKRQDFGSEGQDGQTVEDSYIVVNGDAEETAYSDPMTAHDALVAALRAAMTEAAVEGIWESNGLLLSQLREGGLASAAESLHTVYDGRLKEFARPDTSSPAHGNGADAPIAHAGAPQGTGAAAPHPSATMADSTPEGRRSPAQPTPAPSPHKAEGHAKGGGDLLGGRPAESKPAPGKAPNSPLAKTGPKGNWGAFTPWLLEQLRTLPRDKISDFIAAHSAECDYFAENQTDVWDEAQTIMDARRG